MHHLLKQFILLICMVALSSCAQDNAPQSPRIRIYTPRYIDFTYKIDGKVQIRHSYLFGAGVEKCYYVGRLAKPYMEDYQLLYPYKSDVIDDFFYQNGHMYQGGANSDRNVLGYPKISRIGSHTDQTTGEQINVIHNLWLFESICGGFVGPFSFSISLQKSSYQSIEEAIAQTKELIENGWKELAHWEPESVVQRGSNTWTVFKTFKQYYLGDATEEWYLPVADGDYYYNVSFSYKTSMMAHDPDQYARGRDMFNHILDSFVVRDLTAEEKAAIVNPEPVEIKPSQMTAASRENREIYRKALIDRLHRHDSANNKTTDRQVIQQKSTP